MNEWTPNLGFAQSFTKLLQLWNNEGLLFFQLLRPRRKFSPQINSWSHYSSLGVLKADQDDSTWSRHDSETRFWKIVPTIFFFSFKLKSWLKDPVPFGRSSSWKPWYSVPESLSTSLEIAYISRGFVYSLSLILLQLSWGCNTSYLLLVLNVTLCVITAALLRNVCLVSKYSPTVPNIGWTKYVRIKNCDSSKMN